MIPFDVKNRPEMSLLDGSKELNVVTIQGPGFATINHQRDDALIVDPEFCFYCQVSAVGNP